MADYTNGDIRSAYLDPRVAKTRRQKFLKFIKLSLSIGVLLVFAFLLIFRIYKKLYYTPERVSSIAYLHNESIHSAQIDGSLTVSPGAKNQWYSFVNYLFGPSVVLNFKYTFDNNDPNNFNLGVHGDLMSAGQLFAPFEILSKENKLFFRVGALQQGSFNGIQSYLQKWILVTPNMVNSISQEPFLKNLDEHKLADFSEGLVRNYPINATSELHSGELDNQEMFRYSVSLDNVKLKQYIDGLFNNPDITNAVDRVKFKEGEIWVGKNDFYIHRIVLSFDVDKESSADLDMSAKLTMDLSKFNEPISYDFPDSYYELDKLFSNDSPEEKYAKVRDEQRHWNISAISDAISTYYSDGGPNIDWPTKKTCIGSAKYCFDLGSVDIYPYYLQTIPIDIGKDASDTGYYIYKDSEGIKISIEGETEKDINSLIKLNN